MRPPGTSATGTSASAARRASSPPDVITTTRAPRDSAASNSSSVSAVPPEYDDTSTSVSCVTNAGSSGVRITTTGAWTRSTASTRSTSPAIAEPPIPQNTIEGTSSTTGNGVTERPIASPARHWSGSAVTVARRSPASTRRIASASSRSTAAPPAAIVISASCPWPASRPRRSASRGSRRGSDTGSRIPCRRGCSRTRGSRAPLGRSDRRGSRAVADRGSRRSSCVSVGPDQSQDLIGLLAEQLVGPGFHVQSQQRLGVARPHVEPPVVELYRQPVEPVLPPVAVRRRDLLDLPPLVGDGRVDLARRAVAMERRDDLRERALGLRELLEDDHGRDQARVGPVVLAEVVVARVLATEDRAGLGHHLLDERVSDASAD